MIFLVAFLDLNAQTNISKRSLKDLLKIERGESSKVWSICNSNQNTAIELYSDRNYFYQSNSCCEFTEWEFYKKGKIRETFLQVCKEPSTAKVTTEKDYYSIKIEEENGKTYLSKYHKDKLVIRFRIIEITEISLPKQKEIKCKIIKMVKE